MSQPVTPPADPKYRMSLKEQCEAVAKSQKWIKHELPSYDAGKWTSPRGFLMSQCPNYDSLTAMHEAWMSQDAGMRIQLHQILMDIINEDTPKDEDGNGIKENCSVEFWCIATFEATVAQRRKAYLIGLGLWK